jgi:hypothetical protein
MIVANSDNARSEQLDEGIPVSLLTQANYPRLEFRPTFKPRYHVWLKCSREFENHALRIESHKANGKNCERSADLVAGQKASGDGMLTRATILQRLMKVESRTRP